MLSSWFATRPSALTWPDYAVLVGSLALLVSIGLALSREQHDTVDFFLARRRVPWWAACLSFLATEVSAPASGVSVAADKTNWIFYQFD